jgi:ABC-type multidrug transport system ATPase subunit
MTPILVLNSISKSYRGNRAVTLKSLTLQEGDRLLVRGPNGCGKSTFLRIVAGLTEPDEGEILWNSQRLLSTVYLPQAVMGFSDLSVSFNELLLGLAIGSRHDLRAAATKLTAYFDTHMNVPLGTLSGGYRRLFALRQVCSAGADIFILDEPLSQLDDLRIGESIRLLDEIAATAKIMIASQPSNQAIQPEFESLWNRQLLLGED